MRYIWNGEKLVEVGEAPRAPLRGPMIMRDTPGVVDPIHGQWLEGRSARREYMKRNEVREYDPGESPKRPVEPSWVKDWRAGRGIERSDV